MPVGSARAARRGRLPVAIPDSGVPNELYRWNATSIDVDDATSPFDWPVSGGGLDDASPINSPTFRQDQAGVPAGEYSGENEAHQSDVDSNAPQAGDSISVFVTCYFNSEVTDHTVFEYSGEDTTGFYLVWRRSVDITQLLLQDGLSVESDTEPSPGGWVTMGARLDDTADEASLYLNGVNEDTRSNTISDTMPSDANFNIEWGRREGSDSWELDGFMFDVTVADAAEPDSIFSDYHDNMMNHIND